MELLSVPGTHTGKSAFHAVTSKTQASTTTDCNEALARAKATIAADAYAAQVFGCTRLGSCSITECPPTPRRGYTEQYDHSAKKWVYIRTTR